MEHKNDAEKIKRILEQSKPDNWGLFEEACDPGERHDPVEIMERNAAFLIESSHKIAGYDEVTLSQMEQAFDLGNYPKVIDLAYQYDRERRCEASLFTSVSNSHLDRVNRVKGFVTSILNLLK